MEKHSKKFMELMSIFEDARMRYRALVKGAEASHMMLEQYTDLKDLIKINDMLDFVLKEAKDRLSDYDEYNEVTSATIALQNAVKCAIYTADHVSKK